MALEVAVGTFATGTGTTTVNVNTVGFQPNAVLLFSCYRGTDGSGAADYHFCAGFSADNGDYGRAAWSDDDSASSNVSRGRHITASVVSLLADGSDGWDGEAQLTFDADGFDVTISNAFGSDVDFIWLALGADVEAAVGQFTFPSGSGVTSGLVSGLSFTPKCVLFLLDTLNSASTTTTNRSSWGFGCATGSAAANNWVIVNGQTEAGTTNTGGYAYLGECCATVSHGSPTTTVYRAILDSFTSGGFELNVLEGSGAGTPSVIYVALGGAAVFEAGKFDEPTSGTALDISLAAGSQTPKAVLIASSGRPLDTQDVGTDDAVYSVGVATGTAARYAVAGTDDDAEATSETWTAQSSVAVGIRGDLADGIASQMDVSELGGTADQFSIVMDTADGSATADWFYLAIGDPPTQQASSIWHAPAVTVSATRAVAVASMILAAPSVSAATTYTATADPAPAVWHAPGVTTSTGPVTRTITPSLVTWHAPAVTVSASVSRTVDVAVTTWAAPAVGVGTTVTTSVGAAGWLWHAPGVDHAPDATTDAAPWTWAAPAVTVDTTVTASVGGASSIWRAPVATGTTAGASTSVGVAPTVWHAPGVTVTTSVSRVTGAAPVVYSAPAVTVSTSVARSVGSASLVWHAPTASAAYRATIATAPVTWSAPAVSVTTTRTTTTSAASLLAAAPDVVTSTTVSRGADSAPFTWHAPGVTVSVAISTSAGTAALTWHAPGVTVTPGAVTRSVDTAVAVWVPLAPVQVRQLQSRAVDSGAWSWHAPAVAAGVIHVRCPPYTVSVSVTTTTVAVASTASAVSVDNNGSTQVTCGSTSTSVVTDSTATSVTIPAC